MSKRPMVIVTTRLPPQVCGIGTYSWLLHRHWPGDSSHVEFLVVDGAARSVVELDHSAIFDFSANAAALSRALHRAGSADVVLHYAGRAYQRYGCPLWLPPVFERWRAGFPSGRLLIFFHELPGNVATTLRHRLIDLCNRQVIRKLARIANVLVTNANDQVTRLQKISNRRDVYFVPSGSNILPINDVESARARTEFVIFGLAFGRWQMLQMFDMEIRLWQRTGRLTKLHLVGPNDEKFDQRSRRIIAAWKQPEIALEHGMLSSNEVSRLLARAQCGLTNATPQNWSKSSVFMAYAAHGCAIVGRTKSKSEPLCFTVSPEEVATISDIDLNERTRRVKNWYQQNADWNVIARRVSELLPLNVPEEAVK